MTLLNILIPSRRNLASHPVYNVEHQVRLRRNPREFNYLYLIIVLALIVLPLIGVWAVLVEIRLEEARTTLSATIDRDLVILDATQELIGWLFLTSIGLALVLDVAGILSSVGSINRERQSGHWSLIRLTNLNRHAVVKAKHILAQEYAVRVLIVVINLRLSVIILFALFSIVVQLPSDGRTNFELFQQALDEDRTESLLSLTLISLFLLIYVIEPLWRIRAVTAFGTALSARIGGASQALMAGLASIAFMWISQGILLIAFFAMLFFALDDVNVSDVATGLVITISIVGLIGVLIYTYYRLIRQWGLRWAVRAGFYREV